SFGPGLSGIEDVVLFTAAEHHSKEPALPDFSFPLLALAPVHSSIHIRVHQCAALIETIEGAGLDETFDDTLVHRAQVHAFTEIKHRLGRLVGNNGCDCSFPNVFDGSQSKPYAALSRRKVNVAGIDVGWQNSDSHIAALVDVLHYLVLVTPFT